MILHADCIEAMCEMDEASVDAIVTDPPYGLEFMGKEWDRLTEVAHANRGTQPDRKRPPGEGGKSAKFQLPSPAFDLSADANRRMQDWHHAWATEALRVLKPGGHLLAFGGTRTYHRLTCAIEDAGFEIRDCIAWLYGSGFPKSLDVSKAIDKAAGAAVKTGRAFKVAGEYGNRNLRDPDAQGAERDTMRHEPATPEAAQWQGWGTALKPAHEPIVLARKPLIGTVSRNVQEFGTGALNVDGCRVEGAPPSVPQPDLTRVSGRATRLDAHARNGEMSQASGRWPANVVLSHLPECEAVGTRRVKASLPASGPTHEGPSERGAMAGDFGGMGDRAPANYADADGREEVTEWRCAEGCPVAMLDEQSGERPGASSNSRDGTGIFDPGSHDLHVGYGDTGGASRFFYTAKASRAERNAGLGGFPKRPDKKFDGGEFINGNGTPSSQLTAQNSHPTVKPISLMCWLVRLVTPPGGRVLDPFAGSGTTGCAAALEGFDFIGIEREAEYVAIAEARIAWWSEHQGREAEEVLADSRRSEVEREKHEASGQMELMEPAA